MTTRRNTLQRKTILDELRRSRTHASASELHQIVRHSLPRLSLGTVYRNLDILHREGLVKKLRSFGRVTRFDAVTEHHNHLRCVNCGRIDDADIPVVIKVRGNVASITGWEVSEPQVDFQGLCPDCRIDSRKGNTADLRTKKNTH